MASFNVDYDPASWVLVPFEFPSPLGESADEWAGRVAQEQRERGYLETARTGSLDDYFRQLVTAAQRATEDVAHDTMWALIKHEAPGFVMAALDLEEADEPFDDFVNAVAAPRPNQYEPAVVTPVELPNLGDGVRVVRHDFDEDRQLYVTVYFVFRVNGADFLLTTQSFDVPAVDWALPLFEELLAGAKIETD
jgi:hypothetical protein